MNIKECIDQVDNVKPNQYQIAEKVKWLEFLDRMIIEDVLKTHEDYDTKYDDFEGYSPDDLTKQLIVDTHYSIIYPSYLKMKIDEENGETARYNNSSAMFNAYYEDCVKNYNKNHMPLCKQRLEIF